ncbi:hypothetical protein [Amycolatopsis keratiniphila]|uniref:Uncharacterized protein n=1 Tax=Amycolatopsis keratiniphila TaxID=129921 RepID=R4T9X8_9PSEU|nr:hypothetical protein [Amycolatopsis keratiniphila]AGM07692.1 hypothetical protein AORI_5108 [Amycolatopsis keratiniphila]
MADEEDLEPLLKYAREGCVGLSVVVVVAEMKAGPDATFAEMTAALLSVVGTLIDRGAVPGDLVDGEPCFVAWQGSKSEILGRLACEIKTLGEIPATGEVCWIHDPAATEADRGRV